MNAIFPTVLGGTQLVVGVLFVLLFPDDDDDDDEDDDDDASAVAAELMFGVEGRDDKARERVVTKGNRDNNCFSRTYAATP